MAELSVLEKARRVMVAYITAANVGTDRIYNGKASAEKGAPMVGCGAANALEEPVGTGNFWIDLEVKVKSIAAVDTDAVDPKDDSDTLSAKVLEALKADTLADQLNAAAVTAGIAFNVFGFGEEYRETEDVDGDCWVETWQRRAYCCGAALT